MSTDRFRRHTRACVDAAIHCVFSSLREHSDRASWPSYVRGCVAGYSSIWSLRFRWSDESLARSVLTIEVNPRTRMIVQCGTANSRPQGRPLELMQRWVRERLQFHRSSVTADGAAVAA